MLSRRPLTWSLVGLSGLLALAACQSPPNALPNTPSSAQNTPSQPPTAAQPERTHRVSFRFTPDAAFRTLAVQPRYAKLTISKDSTVKYAQEGDAQTGFINTQEEADITAELSDGRWSATLGLYFTPTSNAFLEFKGVFDVDSTSSPSLPIDNVVELNSSTYFMGAIADEIRQINPTLYNSMSLPDLKEYTRGLLAGSATATENNPYPKLVGKGLVPATPAALSAEEIAYEINAGRINLTFNEGNFEAEPQRYRLSPSLAGNFQVRAGWPAGQLPAINKDGKMFLQQTDANSLIPSYLHGFVPDPLHPTRLAIPSSNFGDESSPGQSMAGRISQQYPVLGIANTTGSNSIPVVYTYVKEMVGSLPVLKAINQSNGSVVWSHNFTMPDTFRPQILPEGTSSILAVKLNKGSDPNCDCDDIDTVFVSLNGNFYNQSAGVYERKTFVYALRQSGSDATRLWSQEFLIAPDGETPVYNPLATSGALSRDGSKLYLVSNKYTGSFKPFLTTLDTETGAIINNVEFNGTNGESVAHGVPTVGSDGTVYVISKHIEYQTVPSNRIYAFNPDGTRKWNQEVSESFNPHLLIDHQNGQDILYALGSITGRYIRLYSYYVGSGLTSRWVTPFELSAPPDPDAQRFADVMAPVIGQHPNGSRMIYIAYNIRLRLGGGENGEIVASKVAAVHDQNATPSLAWEIYPGGVIRKGSTLDGLSLLKSHLYVGTSNGGENQGAGLQAIKVSTPAMPSSAPWPKMGGNSGNQGVSHDLPNGH